MSVSEPLGNISIHHRASVSSLTGCLGLLQMTSHSSSRSSGWKVAAAWLFFGVLCEWLNVFVSRWRRQPGEPTAHSSSDEVTAKITANHSLVSRVV